MKPYSKNSSNPCVWAIPIKYPEQPQPTQDPSYGHLPAVVQDV